MNKFNWLVTKGMGGLLMLLGLAFTPVVVADSRADLDTGWAFWEKGDRERAMAHFGGWLEDREGQYTVVTELKCSPGKLVQAREDIKGYGPVFLNYHEFKNGLCFRICVGIFENKKAAKTVATMLRTDGVAAEAFPVKANLKDAPKVFLEKIPALLKPLKPVPAAAAAKSNPEPAQVDYQDGEVSSEDKAKAEALFQEGVVSINSQAVDEAKVYFMQALRLDPNHAGAHNNLGTIFLHLGRFGDAEREFRWALKSEPKYKKAKLNLAGALFGQGRKDESARELRRLLQEDEQDLEVRLNLASILNAMSRTEDAREHLKILLRDFPTDPRVLDLAKRMPSSPAE